jgi:hypothetical protein
MRPVNAHNALCDVMPLNLNSYRAYRLRRLFETRQLLLELREEVLPAGHEVWHVTCTVLARTRCCSGMLDVPREPQAPLLRFATESPWTLWYTDGWSFDARLAPLLTTGPLLEEEVPPTLSRYPRPCQQKLWKRKM